MSQILLYFLHRNSVLSFYIDVVLTLSIWIWHHGQQKWHRKVSIDLTCSGCFGSNGYLKLHDVLSNHFKCIAVFFNTLWSRKNGRHFPDDTLKHIFLNENVTILIKMSQKFVFKGPMNNILALVQIMACRRPGDNHYLNQWWLDYWHIYASFGLN